MNFLGNYNGVVQSCEELREALYKRASGITNYGLVCVNEKGEVKNVYKELYSGCLSGLYNPLLGGSFSPLVCVNSMQVTPPKEVSGVRELRIKWGTWLMNESPWRHAFILKDKFNPSLNYSIATSCYVDANYMATVNNIIRLGVENRDLLITWGDLVTKGVHPALALCLSTSCVKYSGKDLVLFGIGAHFYYHSVFYKSSTQRFCEVLSGKPLYNQLYKGASYKERLTYSGAAGILEGGPQDHLERSIRKFLGGRGDVTLPRKKNLIGKEVGEVVRGLKVSVKELNEFWRCYAESSD